MAQRLAPDSHTGTNASTNPSFSNAIVPGAPSCGSAHKCSELHGDGDRQLHAHNGSGEGVRISNPEHVANLRSAVPAMAVQCKSSGWPGNDGMCFVIIVACTALRISVRR